MSAPWVRNLLVAHHFDVDQGPCQILRRQSLPHLPRTLSHQHAPASQQDSDMYTNWASEGSETDSHTASFGYSGLGSSRRPRARS
eukprot:82546-Rhodomonas_salina.4